MLRAVPSRATYASDRRSPEGTGAYTNGIASADASENSSPGFGPGGVQARTSCTGFVSFVGGISPNLRRNEISRPSADHTGALSMPNCGSTYAIVLFRMSKTTMKAQVSRGFGGVPAPRPRPVSIARGFSNASFDPSGENTRLRTVPRIVSNRAGVSQGDDDVFLTALHPDRASSLGQAEWRPLGEMTALAGGAFGACGAAATAGAGGAPCWATSAAVARIRANDSVRGAVRMVPDCKSGTSGTSGTPGTP